jgi:hypothetical protein
VIPVSEPHSDIAIVAGAVSVSAQGISDPAFIEPAARAIMPWRERALYIDSENKTHGERADVAAAARSGRTFFVPVADHVLALDADSPEAGLCLEKLVAELEAEGILPIVIESGRPGHRHLFATRLNRIHLQRWWARAREEGIAIRSGVAGIRPPGTPHRLGLPVKLIHPATANEALLRLERSAAAP